MALTLAGILEAAQKNPPLRAEAELLASLRRLPLERRVEFFEALNERSGPREAVMTARRALLRLWAEEDPDGALRGLARHGRPWSGANVEIVVSGLTARGWEFAHSRLEGLSGSAGDRGREILAGWAIRHAPDRVAEAMRGFLDLKVGRGMSPALIRDWAQADRKAAEAWLADIPSPKLLESARREFCHGLARQDVREAERWIGSLPDPAAKTELRRALAEAVVKEKSPAEAVRFLTENPQTDSGLHYQLAGRWARTDAEAALAWAGAQPEGSAARKAAFNAWVNVRAESVKSWQDVLSLAGSMPGENERRNCIAQAMNRLSPAEAASHLDEATGEWRGSVWSQVMRGSPELPLDQAMALAPRYAAENTGENGVDLGPLTQRLAGERGPEAALDWALTLPDKTRETVETDIWTEWADQDAEAALKRAGALTENKERQDVLTTIAAAWARRDSLAASGWFSAQPPGAERDAAAAGMIPQLVQTDPAGALIWAAAIGDDSIRERTLRAVRPPSHFAPTEHWRKAVEASGLSGPERKLLMNQP